MRGHFTLLFLLVTSLCMAQVAFQGTYGGVGLVYAINVIPTDDEGYAVIGSSQNL
ncbi:MAG: hypothetical protein JKX73_10880, partial [Flavobacteriales bacterium]|nr:hypothetical protein [Flavobacteriales bacterium]